MKPWQWGEVAQGELGGSTKGKEGEEEAIIVGDAAGATGQSARPEVGERSFERAAPELV